MVPCVIAQTLERKEVRYYESTQYLYFFIFWVGDDYLKSVISPLLLISLRYLKNQKFKKEHCQSVREFCNQITDIAISNQLFCVINRKD